jgi:hypothetical protein
VLIATVTKDVVADSPKADLDNWNYAEVRFHYGLDVPVETTSDVPD